MTDEFEQKVNEAMEEVVKTHRHDHPLYMETSIHGKKIDPENRRAAFVLFEQIDTDRCTAEGSGWLGDQFRYSVWYMQDGEKPKQLFEDHGYVRSSPSALTGSKGHDPTIDLVGLAEDGIIIRMSPQDAQSAYNKTKVKLTLEGKIEEPEDFEEQASNLVKRIGAKLGYDYLRGLEVLKGKNVAAAVWGAENGSTYGYDTIYLVWKDNKGALQHRALVDSRSTKDYLFVNGIEEKDGKVIVSSNNGKYSFDLKNLIGERK